jgi:glutamate/tyrosine decarboxylase-like PLP-dependent enzyme
MLKVPVIMSINLSQAAASAQYRHLVTGVERADSWATDAHKTLNVPYDSGIAIVANAEAMYAAMGVHAAYLIQDERPDPFSTVPEFSRRARGFTVWAALRSLGRRGVAEIVERFCACSPVCRRIVRDGWGTCGQ